MPYLNTKTVEAIPSNLLRDEEARTWKTMFRLSLLKKLESGIKARKRGDTVRFVYDKTCLLICLDFLVIKIIADRRGR